MHYYELLNRPEWRAKRDKILCRDKYTCQRCGLKKTLNGLNTQVFRLKGDIILNDVLKLNNSLKIAYFDYDGHKIFVKTESNIYNINEKQHLFLNWNLRNPTAPNLNVNFSMNKESPSFFELNKNTINLSFIQLLKDKKKSIINFNQIDIEGFYILSLQKAYENFKCEHLHVHHKCYRENVAIWDQDETEYITLCNVCHLIIHTTHNIPFYNENGIDFHLLEPCTRCNGQGYIPYYKHIQNGICFDCMGSGMINPKNHLPFEKMFQLKK